MAHTRPTLVEKAKGKVPYGLYIRDIAEVREGAEAFDFRCNPHAPMPEEEDFCMSLIGSECSICLQCPSKFARDWFVERFQALIDDILSEEEKEVRAKRNLSKLMLKDLTRQEIDSADQIVPTIKSFFFWIYYLRFGQMLMCFLNFICDDFPDYVITLTW